jgi:hypothetical protein
MEVIVTRRSGRRDRGDHWRHVLGGPWRSEYRLASPLASTWERGCTVVHTAYKKVSANIDLIRARPYDHGGSYAEALLTSTQDLRTLGAPSPLVGR